MREFENFGLDKMKYAIEIQPFGEVKVKIDKRPDQ
jgi:hypothetical protein